jgi:hypothetical protein
MTFGLGREYCNPVYGTSHMNRRMMTVLSMVIATTACAHSSVDRSPRAPASVPALSTEMAPLGFYVGRWSCRGADLDASGATTHTYDLVVDVTPRLDGSWLEIVVSEGGIPVTHELKGFDHRDHKFHHVWATTDGEWGSLTSDGWVGDGMTFVDDKPAPGTQAEHMVFTRVDDRHYSHRAESPTSDGWQPTFTKVCEKR